MIERYRDVNGWVTLGDEALFQTLYPENAQKAADALNGLLDKLAEAEARAIDLADRELTALRTMEKAIKELADRDAKLAAVLAECERADDTMRRQYAERNGYGAVPNALEVAAISRLVTAKVRELATDSALSLSVPTSPQTDKARQEPCGCESRMVRMVQHVRGCGECSDCGEIHDSTKHCPASPTEDEPQPCGYWDGPDDHVYGVCDLPAGHVEEGNALIARGHALLRHREIRDGKLWAGWGGGEPPPAPSTSPDQENQE